MKDLLFGINSEHEHCVKAHRYYLIFLFVCFLLVLLAVRKENFEIVVSQYKPFFVSVQR